jgi:glycosyltransferase involved in cell wall biosynthesis
LAEIIVSGFEDGCDHDGIQTRHASCPGTPAKQDRNGYDMVVSAHFVYAGRVGGAEPMLYNLLSGLSQECSTLTAMCADRANLDPLALSDLEQSGVRVLECGGPGPRFISEQRACLDRDVRGDITLFPNYFVPPVTPARLGRIACVLHDMQFRHFPQYFSARKRLWLRVAQGLAIRKADRVIAISEFVRNDVIRVYGEELAKKVSVVPNPISWRRFGSPTTNAAPPSDRPYILSVAAQYSHKNLDVLIRGFAQLAHRDADVALVLCGQSYATLRGGGGVTTDLRGLIEHLGLADRVHMTGYVDDLQLGVWYRGASVFAFPSLFEGFGMPAVEALGMGLPVLTTRCTALPETTLGLAAYVDNPTDSREWAEKLGYILRYPAAYAPDRQAVRTVRERYDMARIARAYVDTCAG